MQSVPYFSALDRSDFVWAQALSGDVWPRDRVEFPFSRVVSYVLDLPMKKTEKSGRKREGEGGGERGKGRDQIFSREALSIQTEIPIYTAWRSN